MNMQLKVLSVYELKNMAKYQKNRKTISPVDFSTLLWDIEKINLECKANLPAFSSRSNIYWLRNSESVRKMRIKRLGTKNAVVTTNCSSFRGCWSKQTGLVHSPLWGQADWSHCSPTVRQPHTHHLLGEQVSSLKQGREWNQGLDGHFRCPTKDSYHLQLNPRIYTLFFIKWKK